MGAGQSQAGQIHGLAALQFFPDMTLTRLEETGFSLIHTTSDDAALWAPAV